MVLLITSQLLCCSQVQC